MATIEQKKFGDNQRKLIKNSADALNATVELNLSAMSDKMIEEIKKNMTKLSEKQKYKATNGVNAKGLQKYKAQLREVIADISQESWNNAVKVVGIDEPIKFNEPFDQLPKSVRDRINKTVDLLAGTHVADLEKNIYF